MHDATPALPPVAPGTLLARYALLLAIALLPAALTCWRQRRDLRLGQRDRFRAWFDHFHWQREVTVAVWGGVSVVVGLLDLYRLTFRSLAPFDQRLGWLAGILLAVGLPTLIVLPCRMLATRVYALVPEVGWTRHKVMRMWLLSHGGIVALAIIFAFCLVLETFEQKGRGEIPWRSLIGGLVVGVYLASAWWLARGFRQTPLAEGEIDERLNEIAEERDIRFGKAYALSTAYWRLINVFDRGIVNTYFAPDLAQQLTRREVDALLAHELGRIYWRWGNTVGWAALGRCFVALLVIGVVVGLGVASGFLQDDLEQGFPIGVGAWIVLLSLATSGHERFHPRRDNHAIEFTADPEALITALAKLRRLDLLPLTHARSDAPFDGPMASWERLQDIAHRHGIPPQRLQEILASPGTGEDCYAPQPFQAADGRVFSAERKGRFGIRYLLQQLLLPAVIPALAVVVGLHAGVTGAGWWLVGIGAYAVYLLCSRLLSWHQSARLTRWLEGEVGEKLAAEGLSPATWNGWWVGFGPDGRFLIYEGYYDWDVGWLVPAGDRLCFVGDRCRFALRREQVIAVSLGSGPPNLRGRRRVYLTWRDDAAGDVRVFHFDAGDERSPWKVSAGPRRLAERLARWLGGEEPGERTPALADLPPWPSPPLQGVEPRNHGSVLQVLIGAVIVLAVAALVIAAVGLPLAVPQPGPTWIVYAIVLLEVVRPYFSLWRPRPPRIDAMWNAAELSK